MLNLIAAAAFFVLLHLVVSGTRLRDVLTGRIGQNAYMGAFSLASVAGLTWLIMAYGQARGQSWNVAYWTAAPATRHLQFALQLLAMLLIVPGLATPNPTSVRQEASLERANVIQGMLRITRHPFLWGVGVWAAGHLLVNGDRASILLFGSLLGLALFGTASIDAKRKRALGQTWDAFAAQTSNLPFGAIAGGRQTLRIGEIGWWRIALAIGAWAGLLVAHSYIAGVSVLG